MKFKQPLIAGENNNLTKYSEQNNLAPDFSAGVVSVIVDFLSFPAALQKQPFF